MLHTCKSRILQPMYSVCICICVCVCCPGKGCGCGCGCGCRCASQWLIEKPGYSVLHTLCCHPDDVIPPASHAALSLYAINPFFSFSLLSCHVLSPHFSSLPPSARWLSAKWLFKLISYMCRACFSTTCPTHMFTTIKRLLLYYIRLIALAGITIPL